MPGVDYVAPVNRLRSGSRSLLWPANHVYHGQNSGKFPRMLRLRGLSLLRRNVHGNRQQQTSQQRDKTRKGMAGVHVSRSSPGNSRALRLRPELPGARKSLRKIPIAGVAQKITITRPSLIAIFCVAAKGATAITPVL